MKNTPLQDLDGGEKTDKRGKGHEHCMTWNMARNTEKRANEIHTLQDLEYGEKTAKRRK